MDFFDAHRLTIGPIFAPTIFERVSDKVLMVEVPAPVERIPLITDPKTIKRPPTDEDLKTVTSGCTG